MSQHLLPCTCGRNVTVQSAQAGQQTACACGQILEIPKLREIARLPRAASEPATNAVAWRPGYGMALAGLLLTIGGVLSAVYLHTNRQELVDPAGIRRTVDAYSPSQLWLSAWPSLEQGIARPAVPAEAVLIARHREQGRWLIVSYGLASVGVVLAIAGMVNARASQQPAAARARTPQRA